MLSCLDAVNPGLAASSWDRMPPSAPRLCSHCQTARAVLKRPKNHDQLCRECFYSIFEEEVHQTILSQRLFRRGERVALAASGGKDSTVLAHVVTTLNKRYDYGLDLFLLSIDEGISGYRDDSLDTVKRNEQTYGIPLVVISYKQLYDWTMDEIVAQIGTKNNCTFCGVFRRQALDRGAVIARADKIATGHNADDVAETVLLNILRGDVPRLGRCASAITGEDGAGLPRVKPFKYTYEKEIVMYAYFKKLDYFSTECVYAPFAARGFARDFVKDLEAARPSAILDIIRSAEHFAVALGQHTGQAALPATSTPPPAAQEQLGTAQQTPLEPQQQQQVEKEAEKEVEVSGASTATACTHQGDGTACSDTAAESREASSRGEAGAAVQQPSVSYRDATHAGGAPIDRGAATAPPVASRGGAQGSGRPAGVQVPKQCQRCGYLTSQPVCKACVLLESLNKGKPGRSGIESGAPNSRTLDEASHVQGSGQPVVLGTADPNGSTKKGLPVVGGASAEDVGVAARGSSGARAKRGAGGRAVVIEYDDPS